MRQVLGLGALLVPYIVVILVIKFAAFFIGAAFPAAEPLFVKNTVACFIFVGTDLLPFIPSLFGVVIALIYGAFAYEPWYMPALQVLALKLVFFVVNIIFSIFISTGVAAFSNGDGLNKLNWLNFKSRIGRKQFFLRMMIGFLGYSISGATLAHTENTLVSFLALAGILMFGILNLSTYVKRLHDLGKSGYWSLGILVLNIVTYDNALLNLFVMTVLLCALCFIKGDSFPNQYGDPEAHQEGYSKIAELEDANTTDTLRNL